MNEDPSKFSELDAATAARLCEQQEHILELDGVTDLPDGTAEALRGWQHTLSLDGLATISANAANAITSDKRTELYLNGLTSLGDDVARALGQFEGALHLDGVTNIATTEAIALTDHRHPLSLRSLRSVTDEALRHLDMHPRIALDADVEERMRATSPWRRVSMDRAIALHLTWLENQPGTRTSNADAGPRKAALDLLACEITGQRQNGYLDSIPNDLYEIHEKDLDRILKSLSHRWQARLQPNARDEIRSHDWAIAEVTSFLAWCRKEHMCPKLGHRTGSLGRP